MTDEVRRAPLIDLAIKGNIVLPNRVLWDGVVGVSDGRIAAFYGETSTPECGEFIDAGGSYVLPGAIDAHVHCFSAPQEGFVHTTRSAAAGGVTTVIDMPYDAGAPVMSAERLLEKREQLEREVLVDVALLATIKKRGGLAEIARMAEAGACGFKLSLFETDPERFPRIPDDELWRAFQLIEQTGLTVGVHAENDEVVKRAIHEQLESGNNSAGAHSDSRPRVAESEAVLRAMEFAFDTGVKLHIHHATFPRVFELVRWYRDQGTDVTAETCTHYLILSEEDLVRLGPKGKVNPPLRSVAEREMLWEYCANGMVDLITSDHAPWAPERKAQPNFLDNASGMPGVEALVHLVYSGGVATGRLTIHDLARLLSENPAKRYGLYPQKGQLQIGADADMVILDPRMEWTLDERAQQSTAGWSPYDGQLVRGRITRTIVRGQSVWDGKQIVAEPGFGRFIPPNQERERIK